MTCVIEPSQGSSANQDPVIVAKNHYSFNDKVTQPLT